MKGGSKDICLKWAVRLVLGRMWNLTWWPGIWYWVTLKGQNWGQICCHIGLDHFSLKKQWSELWLHDWYSIWSLGFVCWPSVTLSVHVHFPLSGNISEFVRVFSQVPHDRLTDIQRLKRSYREAKSLKCLLLFTTNTNILILLYRELKTDGKSFIFAVCRLP